VPGLGPCVPRAALLAVQANAVRTALEAEGNDPTHTVTPRRTVQRTVGYDRRNRPYMHFDAYLAHGWPMGTGVVAGAWGHLVKACMEPSGMRGTTGGAPAGLDLRAVQLQGHGDTYGLLHRQPHPHRLYGWNGSAPVLAWTA
jgi:hypothetical protein